MGTNCLCVTQEAGRHCLSRPKGMAQLPTLSRYCLLGIVSHGLVVVMGAISFRELCSLSVPHPASKTLRSGNCNAGCIPFHQIDERNHDFSRVAFLMDLPC